MNERLTNIRVLIESSSIDCLGVGGDESGLLWPIRDEVVDGLSKEIARIAALEAALEKAEEMLRESRSVMRYLAEHGPAIIPHLMDDDENPGERLRCAMNAFDLALQETKR